MSTESFDGAEICELIRCLLFHSLNNITDPSNHSFYRDDWLIIVNNRTPRKCDMIRKKLYWLFNKIRFKLGIQTNLKLTKFFDITFNLYNNTISSYRKKNQLPRYINVGFSHPKQVFKHIPNGIMTRLSINSFNIDIFTQNKIDYEIALKK